MVPITIIEAKPTENSITLFGQTGHTQLMLVGASCPASIKPGQTADWISVFPGDKEEIIAIRAEMIMRSGKQSSSDYFHFILPIVQKNGKSWIELDNIFVPRRERAGQIVSHLGLSVLIGNEYFLSPVLLNRFSSQESLVESRRGYRLLSVDNANLLCRFMAGQAEAEDVKKAATELVVQTVDVPALQEKLAKTEETCQIYHDDNRKLRIALTDAQNAIYGAESDEHVKAKAHKAELEKVISNCEEIINGNPEGAMPWNKNRTRVDLLQAYLGAYRSMLNKPA